MKKKKIIFLLHLPPPCHGAAMVGSYVRDSELIRDQFDSEFINISTSGTLSEIGGVSLGKVIRYFGIWIRLLKYLALRGLPDLIYVTPAVRGMGLVKELPLLCFIRLMRRPIVSHFHNKGLSEYLEEHKVLSGIVRWIFCDARAHAIIISSRLSGDVRSYFNACNMHVIPYGIPVVGVEYSQQSRSGRTIVFLGNLIVSKGILDFLDVCRILKERKVGIEALVIGGEADLTSVGLEAEIDKRGIKSICRYNGPAYGDAKFKVLGSADILVFPTYYPYETFGLVNIEAMACGLPVISTNEGGIPDIIDEGVTGYIISKRNPEEIADRIALLINDRSLREKMGRAGREKYLNEYTVSTFNKRIADVLSECMEDADA